MPRFGSHPERRPVLVAGGSSGIGAATGVMLAAAGYPVALGARRLEKCQEFVDQITDAGGKVLYQAKVQKRQAFSSGVAADVTYALQQVVNSGTGTSAKIGRPAAGKTGTTSGNVSAWFTGFTPQLSAAVTMFRDNNAPLAGIAGYSQIYGGTLPAKMWAAFMKAALAHRKVEQFPPRANVGAPPSPPPSPSAPPSSAPASPTRSAPPPSGSAQPQSPPPSGATTRSPSPTPTKTVAASQPPAAPNPSGP